MPRICGGGDIIYPPPLLGSFRRNPILPTQRGDPARVAVPMIGRFRTTSLSYSNGADIVAAWPDISGHGRDALAISNGLIMKHNALAGYSSAVGDGTGGHDGFQYSFSAVPFFTNHNVWTMFMIVKVAVPGSFSAWASVSEATGDTTWRIGHETDMTVEIEKTFGASANTSSILSVGWHYVVLVAGSVTRVFVDGIEYATWLPGNSGNPQLTPTIFNFGTGWYQVFGGYPRFVGEMTEFILYDGAVTEADRKGNLEGYARKTYGLA